MSVDSPIAGAALSGARVRTRSRFFLGISLLMLAIVVVGFTPTLFGRSFFTVPQMPGYLYVHGLVLAAWFVMSVVQASLIAARRPALHRTLGWTTVVFAAAIPVAGMGTQLALPDRVRAAGIDMAPFVELIQTVFWLNLVSVLQFAGFVIAAVLLRARTEAHKRLMVFASIALIPPAAARFGRWPVFGHGGADLSQPSDIEVVFASSSLLLLTAAVVGHDLLTRRGLHRATWIGALVLVVVSAAAPMVAGSDWGKAVVWAVS